MSGGYNPYYRDLKDEMKMLGIQYSDVAKVTGISLNVIQNWMKKPDVEARRTIISEAIRCVRKSRENGVPFSPITERLRSEGLLTLAQVRLPRETVEKKKTAPQKGRAAPQESVFGVYTQILPWKGRNVNDKRRAGNLHQKRGEGQD